jgi:hypothetical protein
MMRKNRYIGSFNVGFICLFLLIVFLCGSCDSEYDRVKAIENISAVKKVQSWHRVNDDDFSCNAINAAIILNNGGKVYLRGVDFDAKKELRFIFIERFNDINIEQYFYTETSVDGRKMIKGEGRGGIVRFSQFNIPPMNEFNNIVKNRSVRDLLMKSHDVYQCLLKLPYVKIRAFDFNGTPMQYFESIPDDYLHKSGNILFKVYRTDLIHGVYDDF